MGMYPSKLTQLQLYFYSHFHRNSFDLWKNKTKQKATFNRLALFHSYVSAHCECKNYRVFKQMFTDRQTHRQKNPQTEKPTDRTTDRQRDYCDPNKHVRWMLNIEFLSIELNQTLSRYLTDYLSLIAFTTMLLLPSPSYSHKSIIR